MTTITADRRLLNLDAGPTTAVAMDGPALAVSAEGRPRQWYPLRLLSRVVSRPAVAWDGRAILGLMEAGIPLFFVDKDGRLFGACLGSFDDHLGLRAHLDTLIAQPAWPAQYENWLRSQERRVLFHLCEALGWPPSDLRPPALRARLEWELARTLGQSWRERLHPLLGELRTQVIHGLTEAGLDPDLVSGLRGGAALAHDISALLGWTLRGRLVAEPPPAGASGKALLLFYIEQLQQPLANSLRRVITSLWRLRGY
jgi:hypothetical protein